ncbi:lactococcin 972 family bacteriocin [Salana multivorans]
MALPAVAHAEISWVGGGRWDHGADAKDVWSHYDHDTKVHKSSTYGEDGLVSSGWYSAGERSICIQGARLYGNKAYYDFK